MYGRNGVVAETSKATPTSRTLKGWAVAGASRLAGWARNPLPLPRVQELLAGLVAASGIGYLAAAYTLSRWLTRGGRGRPAIPPAVGPCSWETEQVLTADGLRLACWVVTPPQPRGTVALFHGLRGHRGHLLGRIAFLSAAGYRCVACDHRAHGGSAGRYTSFGYYEGRDVAAVLEWIWRRWPGHPCAAFGVSMGAAAICFAAQQARACNALILESLYYDLASAFFSRLGHSLPGWLRRFAPGIIWITERRLGLRLEQIVPADFIGNLAPAPVLLISGSADRHPSPLDIERLRARCQSPCERYLVPGAGHRQVEEIGGAAYQRCILEFLQRHLAAATPAAC
jgi:alpha-beta hydrolase superfamily lysophospholipase